MKDKLQQIVFFTPGFPADESDLNCIPILQNYVHYFKKLNPEIEVSVISFQYPFEKKIYEWNGFKVFAAGGKNKKYLWRLITWFRVWKYFVRINKKQKVNVIHSFWLTECSFVAQWIQQFYKIKIVVSILGQDCLPKNKYLKWLNFSKMKIVAASKFADEKLFDSTHKHADEIISIGLDKERFTIPVSDKTEIDILGVGNLYDVKNYSLFIEIIHELISEFPKLKTVIAGDGVEYEMLQQKINHLNLSSNITLAGKVDRNNVIGLMAKSKILLHTSSHEGQGYVFEEALFSGMSIVAFWVGNLFDDKRIRIANSKQEMIEQLKLLLHNPLPRTRMLMHDMNDTVESYKRIYFS